MVQAGCVLGWVRVAVVVDGFHDGRAAASLVCSDHTWHLADGMWPWGAACMGQASYSCCVAGRCMYGAHGCTMWRWLMSVRSALLQHWCDHQPHILHCNCPCGAVCCCRQVEALLPKEAEFGVPMWVFGARTYCLLEGGKYILTQYNDPTSAGGFVAGRGDGGACWGSG